MKYRLILLFAIIIIINIARPIVVKAEGCTLERLNELKKWSNISEINYFYFKDGLMIENENEGEFELFKNRFQIEVTNLTEDFYAVVDNTNRIFSYDIDSNEPSVSRIDGFIGGHSYTLSFYANTNDACNGYLLTQRVVNLPKYNLYSESDLCTGIEEFELCNLWYQGKIVDVDYFTSKVVEYKNAKTVDETEVNQVQGKWNSIITFIINNYNLLLLSIIVLGTSGIIVIKLLRRRGKLL
ncbi:MAG: hypothetical protein PHS45_01965 [Bacilli bacterium]|nr:hypothetical protein [Bacilli bacterium]